MRDDDDALFRALADDAELLGYISEFTASPATSDVGRSLDVLTVQRALNRIMGAGLREDGILGPSTGRALDRWFQRNPQFARAQATPSADRRRLEIRPPAAADQLAMQGRSRGGGGRRPAPARPSPSRPTPSRPAGVPETLAGAATVLQSAYEMSERAARIVDFVGRGNQNRIPVELSQAFVAYYQTTVALQASILEAVRASSTKPAVLAGLADYNRRTAANPPLTMAAMIEALSSSRPLKPSNVTVEGLALHPAVIPVLAACAAIIAVAAFGAVAANALVRMRESADAQRRLETVIGAYCPDGVCPPGVLPPETLPGVAPPPGGARPDDGIDIEKIVTWGAVGLLAVGIAWAVMSSRSGGQTTINVPSTARALPAGGGDGEEG